MKNKDEALKMAIEAMSISMVDTKGVNDGGYWTLNVPYSFASKAIQACKEALEQPSVAQLNDEYLRDTHVDGLEQPAQEPKCSEHPDAPHGFCRNASHSAGRYVCECEGWEAEHPAQEPVAWYGKDTAFSNGNKIFVFNNKDDANAYGLRKSVSIEPLYTHPAPQQEPVAIVYSMQDGYIGQMVVKDIPHKTKLYTHPAPSWQGLSDDEVVAKVFENDELLARILYLNGASKALKRALKVMNNYNDGWTPDEMVNAIQACKEALEQQEVGDAEIKQMLNDIEYYKNRLAKYEDVL